MDSGFEISCVGPRETQTALPVPAPAVNGANLAEKIRGLTVTAIEKYALIGPGDRILVAVSGGKDSTVLLLTLEEIRRRAPFPFSLQAVILDQGQPGFRVESYQSWLADRGLDLVILREDTYSIVTEKIPKGKTYCSLCSRLRRGILYSYAAREGYSAIALGHHRDDLAVTLLLNLFFAGKTSSMPPKLKSDDGRNTVVRPLAHVPEAWIVEYAATLGIPIIPCNLCGSQDKLQRKKIAGLLREMEHEHPHVKGSILAAMGNVHTSHLLDSNLWDFATLKTKESTRTEH